MVGCEYRKVSRIVAENLPEHYTFTFLDGSRNYWTVVRTCRKPKHYKSSGYSKQVNDLIRKVLEKEER